MSHHLPNRIRARLLLQKAKPSCLYKKKEKPGIRTLNQTNKCKHKLCSKPDLPSKQSCSQPSSLSGQAFIPRGITLPSNLCNSSATLFNLAVVSIHLL
ncbi:hypothetical protein ACFXTO_040511 [Malus domestica]